MRGIDEYHALIARYSALGQILSGWQSFEGPTLRMQITMLPKCQRSLISESVVRYILNTVDCNL